MSLAWKKLRAAVIVLAGKGCVRDRLAACIDTHLTGLMPRDLPSEAHPDFLNYLMVVKRHGDSPAVRPSGLINCASDQEVAQVTEAIINMYDAVTRYQPAGIASNHRQGADLT